LKAGKSATGRRLQTALCAQKRKRMFNKRLMEMVQLKAAARRKTAKKKSRKNGSQEFNREASNEAAGAAEIESGKSECR
jgi:hypothetical protein